MNEFTIRPMRPEDAEEVSAMIGSVLMEVNIKDYTVEALKEFVDFYNPDEVRHIPERGGHSYVAELGGEIIGCASICPYENEGESIIEAFYVRGDMEGNGVGRRLLETLEADEMFLNTKRTVVSSSITAHEFYHKFGYDYVGGVPVLEEEDHYWVEKVGAKNKRIGEPGPQRG